ncbi:glycosyltransferase family 4 protein [Staphylococcus gallinarum]|uniref:glycosyltransferase family 4 protein n=1 Tax=Staphylococcus gallinarum TaxID=1293 RepID=UPI000D1FC19E|nr:glycosyltransferase family 4 protein [Staphylococcus gallinarum]MBU7218148.1 glycosyltransferase family 4 protein [Staphylococcus gallinarum]PTK91231.1 glycosyltransferase family 1 protein [Staphylococcus gallinarum]RIL24905.1 glycosyltransferase family 1 protein [Staphylococcus gallinarum]RIL30486.1 glycosyltransferase family 1 protein [Staphylococcus gallinarum]RIO87050.1 glycosyltransferase family 1 protein [Staphylococcus gallinarum]
MKIVQIAAIEMTHLKLLKALNETSVREGHEVHCISTMGEQQDELEKQGVHVHNINIDRKISPVNNLKSILKMVKLFREIKPDIVHVHTPVAAVLGRIAAKLARVKTIIYTAHGFYFHDEMNTVQYKVYFNIEKWIGKLATDYIFTQSVEDYEVAKKNNFLLESKHNNYLHISNGIDIDNKFNYDVVTSKDLSHLRNNLNISHEDIVVSFIGRLVKEKGILDLLNSYEKLTSKNVKYIIIGDLPDGERDTETIHLIEKFKQNKNITFTGQISNINEYLAISDIYCLPSYREGMPRSIIEAMAMKNAVIATNIRGSREEVVDGETGYIVPLNAPKFIANKIDILANDAAELSRFKNAGYQRAKDLYDEKNVVEKQLFVFDANK